MQSGGGLNECAQTGEFAGEGISGVDLYFRYVSSLERRKITELKQ